MDLNTQENIDKFRQSPKLKVFSIPGHTPDTRFMLFNETEIHVHSVILKLHSAFFRKFLDSPDKKPAEASAKFRYEWVSEIEEDGDWHMIDKCHEVRKLKLRNNF